MSWRPGEPVVLETERFHLRSLEEADASARYLGWLVDPEVTRFMNARHDEASIESLRAFIRRHDNRRSFLLGIFDREDGQHIGNCSAECKLDDRTAQLGVLIGERSYWGRGRNAVAEARTAFLDFLFGPLEMEKAFGPVYARNIPAIFNYKLLGFELEATLRSHVVCQGERMDVLVFAMFRDAWLAHREGGRE